MPAKYPHSIRKMPATPTASPHPPLTNSASTEQSSSHTTSSTNTPPPSTSPARQRLPTPATGRLSRMLSRARMLSRSRSVSAAGITPLSYPVRDPLTPVTTTASPPRRRRWRRQWWICPPLRRRPWRRRRRGLFAGHSGLRLGFAGHRHETDRQDLLLLDRAVGGLGQHHQVLIEAADRHHQAAARFELGDQRRRHGVRRGGKHDGVERRRLGPTAVAVAEAHADVAVAEPGEGVAGPFPERRHDLDRGDLRREARQHRRLVA